MDEGKKGKVQNTFYQSPSYISIRYNSRANNGNMLQNVKKTCIVVVFQVLKGFGCCANFFAECVRQMHVFSDSDWIFLFKGLFFDFQWKLLSVMHVDTFNFEISTLNERGIEMYRGSASKAIIIWNSCRVYQNLCR